MNPSLVRFDKSKVDIFDQEEEEKKERKREEGKIAPQFHELIFGNFNHCPT